MMNIYAIGTSHRLSPVEVRERLAFAEAEIPAALRDLRSTLAAEAAVLSTCNRTEFYVVPRGEQFDADDIKAWLRRWKHFDVADDELFTLDGPAAARHLMQVASGVDSQVIGDIQIIGQVKHAYMTAQEEGSLGKLLSRLFHTALRTGKRVKTETELFSGAASVSYAAVELARKIFHPLHDQRTLVVGAGDTGKLTARSLHGGGVGRITICNRTPERAAALIDSLGFGEFLPFEQLHDRLHEFDIVIVSTGASDYVLTREDVARAASRRKEGMQLIVDISMPRNVDPEAASVPGVFCKDMNDLNSVVESNVARRRADLPQADAIIADELAKFSAWCNLLPVTPVVAGLKQRSDAIVRAELEKVRHRFNEDEFRNIERLVASVVKKVIADPLHHLLDGEDDSDERLQKAEFVKLLFNLTDLEPVHARTPEAGAKASATAVNSNGQAARSAETTRGR